MKFKVGDKVKVRKWDDMETEFGIDLDGDIMCPNLFFTKGMKVYCDNVFVVNKVLESDNSYVLEGLSGNSYAFEGLDNYDFNDTMLIPYQFTKADLKTGMVVETRNGNRYMVYGDKILRMHFHVDLNSYDDKLNNSYGEQFDIVKCFNIDEKCISCIEDLLENVNNDYILWQREIEEPEEKVISSNEAFKVLKEHYGCDVKIKES